MTTPWTGCGAVRTVSMRRGCAVVRVMAPRRTFDEPSLGQLFAEPIVQQLMRRDRIDEATIRRLLRLAAAAQPAPSEPPPKKGLLALAMGSPLRAGIHYA